MTTEVDFREIVLHVCDLLGPFAVRHEAVQPTLRANVAVRLPKPGKTRILFRFMHRDHYVVDVDFDAQACWNQPERYLENLVADLVAELQAARGRRQAATRIVLPHEGHA